MNGEDRKSFKHPIISFLGILIAYLYSFGYGWLSLTIRAAEFRAKIISIIFLGITICAIVSFFYMAKTCITKRELNSIIFLICVIFLICIVGVFYGEINKDAKDTLLEFCVKVVPSVFISMALCRYKSIDDLVLWIDFFEIVTTIGLAQVLILGMYHGVTRAQMESYFGFDYQGISYVAAYMFILNVFMLIIGGKRISHGLFGYVFWRNARIIMASIQFCVSLYSGGRGGFVLIIASVYFFAFYISFITKKIKPVIILFFITLLFIIVMYLLSEKFSLFDAGLERIFEFVGDKGINWDGTSGRASIYSASILLIKDSPIFGYGITGGAYVGMPQCHNLFLDILIEGGVIYLSIVICVFILFARKLRRLIQFDNAYMLIMAIFLGDFINLMFSTIYLRATAIWFALFYIYNIREEKVYENWDA